MHIYCCCYYYYLIGRLVFLSSESVLFVCMCGVVVCVLHLHIFYDMYVQESKDRLAYLIDVFMFTPKDIELNCEVLTWPTRINPVFDENDVVSALRLFTD